MGCPYEFYKEEEKYFPRLYCKVNGQYCIFSKKCLKVDKFVPIEGDLWKECYKYMENRMKDIPDGSYFVESYRPNKKGNLYLYVSINGNVVKILSDFTNFNQNYIYLKEGLDGYEISLTPFVEKKKNYNGKNNNKKNIIISKSEEEE